MNKIYKVMYSKVKQCAVVVSEIAKSHGHNGESSSVRKHAALMAAVLIALGSFSFAGMPEVQAESSKFNNDFMTANDTYWWWNSQENKWETYAYTLTDLFDNRARGKLPNYEGAGAKQPGAITGGLFAQAGQQTITIGNRNAGQSMGSVFIGEHSGYDTKTSNPPLGLGNNYVTSVGFQSDATGWGSIAIGSNATANNTKKTDVAVKMADDKTNNINDIEENPTIEGASVALGYSAQAKDGNIAIGAYSEATTDLSADTSDEAKSYLTGETATSYVSVGKKDAKRRISNVADGAAATDVATVGQLQELSKELGGYKAGFGIKINPDSTDTTKNTISLNRNLGTNYGNEYKGKGNVTFEADGENALILGGGAINDSSYEADKDFTYGAHAKDSVLVGGMNNDIEKNSERALIVGGTNNKIFSTGEVQQTGTDAIIVGGSGNKAEGDSSILIGGNNNEATGLNATIIGGSNNKNDGWDASIWGGYDNQITGIAQASGILGGDNNKILNGGFSYILGGENNTADGGLTVIIGGGYNKSSGLYSSVFGGANNLSNANASTVVGGQLNGAIGAGSVVSGGGANLASGGFSYASGGRYNHVTGDLSSSLGGMNSSVNGMYSTGVAGGSTGKDAMLSLAAGYQSVVADSGIEKTDLSEDNPEDADELNKYSEALEAYGEGDKSKMESLSGYYEPDPDSSMGHAKVTHYDKFSTALGYQATADEPGTIAFGHDAGDESGYTYEWETLTDEKGNPKQNEIDGTTNDYTKAPKSVKKKAPYTSAYYNRLVKVADGIDDHDVVVMEQLKQYAEKDASNIGNNIKVYKTDAHGNVQLDKDKKPIEDKDVTTTAQNGSKDDWGQALGAGTFTTGTPDKATDASTSDQLVTGKTLYNYDKPTGTLNYVSANSTTGQNLSALDAQVKANADTLNDKTHNIKYYSVDENLPKIDGYTNEGNDGAKGMGSIAAGFNTHADGIASTVAGSYSGVINSKTAGLDLRGATALSYGTFNINQNTDATKEHSGVANSIVGQANATIDSNAAIIYGAGNTVTNSYRAIDTSKFNLGKVEQDIARKDAAAVAKDLQQAVPTSGGQVMVMGGGNSVDKAYMTQVTGVGNKVSGQDSTYAEGTSTQYNFVDGFQNELSNGKNDYIIGTNNKVSGDSVDKNQSNIIFGDNHKLTNQKNNVIIGSSDEVTEMAGSDAVSIGHNANAGGASVALGSNAVAGGNALAVGPNANAKNNSIALGIHASATSSQNLAIGYYANVTGRPDTIKNSVALGSSSTVGEKDILSTDNEKGVLSIGAKDNERRIIHVRAGVNDTDAVNVSQLKSVQSGLTDKGLTFVTNDGEHTAKLGSKVTIQGTAKKADHEYTADNLTTAIDKDGNITILMDKDMSTEKLTVNGKDGKDGQPGTAGSIGIKGQDGEAGIGIDGKNGISIKGKDGKDGVTMKAVDGKDGTEGHIGLTGPKGTNGKDGTNAIDITVKNGYDGENGINGKNGVDGTSLTRIVYTDKTGEHQVATLEDGLKFKGDDDTVIAKKLNNTLDIIGGANSENLTDGNIGVNSTDKGQLKVQLAKDLTGITSISNQTTTKVDGKDVTTGAKIILGNDGSVDVNGGKITNVGSGIEADENGKYTVTDQNQGNAANIGDVRNMVNDAKTELTDGANGLNKKANIDASNIGSNITVAPIYQKDEKGQDVIGQDGQKVIDQKATEDAQNAARTANENDWGSAIGTGKIAKDNGQLVTGKTVYDEVRPMEDGSYVKKDQTTGENLSALDTKIGKLDEDGNYIKKDDSISKNLSTLDTHVKKNADDITTINKSISTLDQNAVKYDNSSKSKITLGGGKDGTTITNVKDGALSDSSKDAVNGKQLYAEQQARKELETKVTSNTTEINNIKDGKGFTEAGKTVIKNWAQDAVQVKAGTAITVANNVDDKGNKTYTISANNDGKVEKNDGNLISGDTLYNEVRPTEDGSYVKKDKTTHENLSALDSGLKATSDLIHTNDNGDIIQIGGSSTATKIDVSGKDANGNTTGRVITGVVSDANDPNSAANVGYVNGVTAANTQQIYRDMNNAYGRLNNNINKAAAGSNALAALHPLDYDPDDKADFAVGYGHYRNANAAAVGAFYHPNENTMVNVGVSLGNGDPGFNAGVSFKIGSGSAGHQAMSKTEMAKVINSQSKEIDALKKDNADKDKRIDALEQKMAEILAKLDKNGK